MWEDEEITYACKNKSLVLNHEKGVVTVTYYCMSDGTYDAPTGVGSDKWPICTNKPIDPCN